jgi:hypothetical protein
MGDAAAGERFEGGGKAGAVSGGTTTTEGINKLRY